MQLPSANSNDGDDPTALYNWEELHKKMRWTAVKLKKVMTSDSYVIIDGNTNNFQTNFTTLPSVVTLPENFTVVTLRRFYRVSFKKPS